MKVIPEPGGVIILAKERPIDKYLRYYPLEKRTFCRDKGKART